MKVSIVGAGYVGVVTAVGLAARGHHVTCFDIRRDVVDLLNSSTSPFYERGLEELLASVVANGRFQAELVAQDQLVDSDIMIITVGTPAGETNINLEYVKGACETVGRALKSSENFMPIVVKSTVVPGTTDTFIRKIIEHSSGKKLGEFGLGMNPEFLREGSAVDDFMDPDRIVLGHDDPATLAALRELYQSWDCQMIAVSSRTAEMIKYANNCLLATQISAVNELANIAAAIGKIDIMDVLNGVTADKRWSPVLADGSRVRPDILHYLVPGPGFGGSCFRKDLEALSAKAREVGAASEVLDAVLDVNRSQPSQVIKLLEASLGELTGRKILLLGLAFKPDTDDVRESVSMVLLESLLAEGSHVLAHDPLAVDNARKRVDQNGMVTFVDGWESVLPKVDAVVIATNWKEYSRLSSHACQSDIENKVIVDTRRLFSQSDFPHSVYLSIGKGG